jgi:hypothetical protein
VLFAAPALALLSLLSRSSATVMPIPRKSWEHVCTSTTVGLYLNPTGVARCVSGSLPSRMRGAGS